MPSKLGARGFRKAEKLEAFGIIGAAGLETFTEWALVLPVTAERGIST